MPGNIIYGAQDIHYVTPETPGAQFSYGPFGRCVYCGATQYTPAGGKLTDEHVVPRGLRGWQVLREASCKACQDIIRPIEAYVMRNVLLPMRHAWNIKSQNKNRPNFHRLLRDPATDAPIEIPLDDPPILLLPHFGVTHIDQCGPPHVQWVFRRLLTTPEHHANPGEMPFPFYVNFNMNFFCRALAKAAHCAMIVDVGIDGFRHVLPDFIRFGKDWEIFNYVGSMMLVIPGFEGRDAYLINNGLIEGRYITRLRLFPAAATPTYWIYSGLPL